MSLHGRRRKVEALWKLLLEDFDNQALGEFLSASAANQQKGQVKFRLQRAVARLNHADKIGPEDTKPIRADIMLCETLNWLDSETSKQAHDLLDKLEEN